LDSFSQNKTLNDYTDALFNDDLNYESLAEDEQQFQKQFMDPEN